MKPGGVIPARSFPLSESQPGVQMAMDLADCIVATEPYGADLFYRTVAGTEDERQAIDEIVPSLGPCLPEGQRVQIDPMTLRAWIGEGLWHAAAPSDDDDWSDE